MAVNKSKNKKKASSSSKRGSNKARSGSNKRGTKSVPKEYPTYQELVGRFVTVDIDGVTMKGVIRRLDEFNKNGTPQTAVFKPRNEAGLYNVNPKDCTLVTER